MNKSRFTLVENEFVGPPLGSLFHTPEFFRLHAEGKGHYFEWLDGENVVATINFTSTESNIWRSPARGTFSGYAFASELRDEDLCAFHTAVYSSISQYNPVATEILLAPMAHDPEAFSRQFYMLRSTGFEIKQCDLNYSLVVNDCPLVSRMSYGNQKRLRKCQREGLIGQQLPLSYLPQVYETLTANRETKRRSMSMTLSQLKEMAHLFTDRIVLFGVTDKDRLAASALCLRLSPEILYIFYWGDLAGYSSFSPVVSLADTIYTYCQNEKITILDAGISTEDTTPNYGLIQFKRGLGFSESLKVRMQK